MAETSFIIQLGQTFGAPGMMVGFLIWNTLFQATAREKVEALRLEYDKARLEADKLMAATMSALTVTINSLPRS